MKQLLRILVNDSSWVTVQATDASTVQDLISATSSGGSFMTLCHCYDGGKKLERILSSQEIPMKLVAPASLQPSKERLGDGLGPNSRPALFIRIVVPSTPIIGKQPIVSQFCGFADVMERRKNIWARRWILLKERSLTWMKSPRDKKFCGHVDLSDAYVAADEALDKSDNVWFKKPALSFVLQVAKPDRLVRIRFGNVLLSTAWHHVLKERCASDAENAHFDFVNNEIEQHESRVWNKREEQFRNVSSLSSVLSCPLAFRVFVSYLKRSHCEEGLLFWHAVKQFKSPDTSDKDAAEMARLLYASFIAEGSPRELSLSCQERAALTSATNASPVSRTLFDYLAVSVLRQLEQEKFTDFKKSSYYRNILVNLPISSTSVLDSTPCLQLSYVS